MRFSFYDPSKLSGGELFWLYRVCGHLSGAAFLRTDKPHAFLCDGGACEPWNYGGYAEKRGLLSFIGENTLQIYLVHGMVLEVVWEQLLAHGALSSNAKLDTIYKELIMLAAIAAACAAVIAVKYMIRRIRVRRAERRLRSE